jgi:hypothetical protein
MSMNLRRERVKRRIDEVDCDWCGLSLVVGEDVFIDLEHGTAYCGRACAEHDHFERGYGPLSSGVAHCQRNIPTDSPRL